MQESVFFLQYGTYTTFSFQLIIKDQDEHLDKIGSSVGVLKNMSHQIGNELDEQNV